MARGHRKQKAWDRRRRKPGWNRRGDSWSSLGQQDGRDTRPQRRLAPIWGTRPRRNEAVRSSSVLAGELVRFRCVSKTPARGPAWARKMSWPTGPKWVTVPIAPGRPTSRRRRVARWGSSRMKTATDPGPSQDMRHVFTQSRRDAFRDVGIGQRNPLLFPPLRFLII